VKGEYVNALEIHPNVTFWYACDDLPSLVHVAQEVANPSEEGTRAAQRHSRLFILSGDALTFNFRPGHFDLIVYTMANSSFLRRKFLDRKISRWLRPTGKAVLLEDTKKDLAAFLAGNASSPRCTDSETILSSKFHLTSNS
jgi:hypothetical protein